MSADAQSPAALPFERLVTELGRLVAQFDVRDIAVAYLESVHPEWRSELDRAAPGAHLDRLYREAREAAAAGDRAAYVGAIGRLRDAQQRDVEALTRALAATRAGPSREEIAELVRRADGF